MFNRADAILDASPDIALDEPPIGRSREGRSIYGVRLGSGPRRVSLIAGCHADEPVGPRLLRHVVSYLKDLPPHDPFLTGFSWWIVPHANPDGAARNRAWQSGNVPVFELTTYLRHAVRELPGDDVEFGFPRDDADHDVRPENRALYDWWRSAAGPFAFHASLHSMAFAAGPWFLVDPAWRDRVPHLIARCASLVERLGYELHDVERHGEKGFSRITRGFCTTPNWRAMRAFFLERGDQQTAGRFRPNSMETMRSLGGDPLTLVSEMPLFITPGVGQTLGPPDPVGEAWRARVAGWRARIQAEEQDHDIRREADEAGLEPMSLRDQMTLQWAMIEAGLEQLERAEPPH